MTDAQTSAVAYQMIMEKLQGTTGYYGTQADTLSNQQAKLNEGWDKMKETMVNALTPAFEEFYKVLQFLATGIEYLSDEVAIGIQYITLFAEDTASAIKDIMSLNFGQIGADWANNYTSIFDASTATKQLGNSMDDATSAANAQDQAQKALGKTVNANTMSFDELHNITNSGAEAVKAQTDATNSLVDALGNLNKAGLGSGGGDQTKGVVIPITGKDGITPMLVDIGLALAALPLLKKIIVSALDAAGGIISGIVTKLGLLRPVEVPVTAIDEVIPVVEEAEAELATVPIATVTTLTALDEVPLGIAEAEAELLVYDLTPNVTTLTALPDVAPGIAVAEEALVAFEGTPAVVALEATDGISGILESIIGTFATLRSTIAGLATQLSEIGLSGIGTAISGGIESAGAYLGGIASTIGAAAEAVAPEVGMGMLALAPVGLATGGIATSPTLAVIAEGGEPEAVIPLSRLGSMMGNNNNSSGGNSGNSTSVQPINVTLQLDGRTLARTMYSYTVNEADRLGKSIGYDTSYNYPK
jgi:hypothetical protein